MASDDRNRPSDPRDLLAAYELGLLDDEERARFEAATAADSDLLDELYDAAPDAMTMAQDPGRYAATAAAALADARPSRLDRLRGLLRVRVLVPAAVAVAVALLVVVPQLGGDGIAELAVLEPLPAVHVEVRADTPAAEAGFHEAMEAYLDARWSDAAGRLAEALADGGDQWPRRHQAHLYLGNSLLLDGRAEAASHEFAVAATAPVLPLREQANWQLAQARLVLDDADGARAALVTLTTSPVLSEQAVTLLAALDDRD